MWTVAAINKKYSDALGTYNSLGDPHLHQYFRKPKIRHHLIKAGLMTSEGKVIPEAVVRLRKLEDERRKQLHELLSEVLESGQTNRLGLQKLHQTRTLESEAKWELVQRAKTTFENMNCSNGVSSRTISNNSSSGQTKKSSFSTSSMNWFRKVALIKPKMFSSNRRQVKVNVFHKYQRPKSSYGVRSSNKIRPDIQLEEELIEQLSSIVSLEGDSIHESDDESDNRRSVWTKKKSRPSSITLQFNGLTPNSYSPRRVQIFQQLNSGGNAIVIFDKLITPGENFTFAVRAHGSKPFCITVLVDGIRDLRVSTCCEHKHKKGSKISHFTLVDVNGGKPCFKCRNDLNISKKSTKLDINIENDSTIKQSSSKPDICLSDSDVDEHQETVIEKQSSHSSSPIDANYNDEQFETYESSAETLSSIQIRSPTSVSSDDNSIVVSRTEIVEAEIHNNPQ